LCEQVKPFLYTVKLQAKALHEAEKQKHRQMHPEVPDPDSKVSMVSIWERIAPHASTPKDRRAWALAQTGVNAKDWQVLSSLLRSVGKHANRDNSAAQKKKKKETEQAKRKAEQVQEKHRPTKKKKPNPAAE
jgi:hypothetical protein